MLYFLWIVVQFIRAPLIKAEAIGSSPVPMIQIIKK